MRRLAPVATLSTAILALGAVPALANHGTIYRLTVPDGGGNPNGSSGAPAMAGFGFVAFHSDATNLIAGGTGVRNVFKPTLGAAPSLVSADTLGGEPNGPSAEPAIDELGEQVAFQSTATDLVTGDDNVVSDIYRRHTVVGTTQRVSLDFGGDDPDAGSFNPEISAAGSRVVFESLAEDFGPTDTTGSSDIYLRDMEASANELISEPQGASGAFGSAFNPAISADGLTVAFESPTNEVILGDPNNVRDIFVRDDAALIEQASAFDGPPPDEPGEFPGGLNYGAALSGDGELVAFLHNGPLAPNTAPFGMAVMLRDRTAETTERVDLTWDGSPSTGNEENGVTGDEDDPSISPGGRWVAFSSTEDSLVPNDTNGVQDIFVRDLVEGRTIRVNVPEAGGETTQRSAGPVVVGDTGGAELVAFASQDNGLVPGDTSAPGTWEVFQMVMDWTLPETAVQTPPPATTTARRVTTVFADDKTGSDFECSVDGGAYAPCASPWLSPPLAVGAHSFQIRSIDRFGNREAAPATANTIIQPQPAQAPPEPDFRRTFNLELVSGEVFVTLPDGRRVRLEDLLNIPAGSTVDTRQGKARLVAETKAGKLEAAVFHAGLFKVAQLRNGITEVRLAGPLRNARASAAGGPSAMAARKRRRIWGSGKGRFRSKGRYSSATVRGTRWLVEDRRGSTLTRVTQGSVKVRDFVKKKTVVVKKGRRYVARKKKR